MAHLTTYALISFVLNLIGALVPLVFAGFMTGRAGAGRSFMWIGAVILALNTFLMLGLSAVAPGIFASSGGQTTYLIVTTVIQVFSMLFTAGGILMLFLAIVRAAAGRQPAGTAPAAGQGFPPGQAHPGQGGGVPPYAPNQPPRW
jgi:hypothetical protein